MKSIIRLSSLFVAGLLFYCYEFFLRLLTGAYQNRIVSHFQLHSHLSFSFLISSYSLTYLLMQIPAGLLLDRFGIRRILVIATLTCGLGNVLFVSGGYPLALASRLIIGVGASFAFVGVLKIAREYLPPNYFGFFASLVISLGTLAAAFAQQISVLLLSYHVAWQTIFINTGLIALPIALFLYLTLKWVPQLQQSNVMPDFKTTLHAAKRLLKIRRIWLNAIWAGLVYVPTVILTAQYGIWYFHSIHHIDHYEAAQAITALMLGWVIISPLMSYYCSKIGQVTIVVTLSMLGCCISLILLTFFTHYTLTTLLWLAFLFGGFSASQVLVWSLFNKICPLPLSGVGIALTNMVITGITEIGQLSSGGLLDSAPIQSLFSKLTGYHLPMQLDSMIFFISIIAGVLMLVALQRTKHD